MADLWPYVPLPDVAESLEWDTDVHRAPSAEMRHSLRGGHQRFQYKYALSSGFQEASRLLRANPYGPWDVPLWTQASKAGAVASADTALTVDLNAEYTDRAVIFGGCDDYLIVNIDSITTTLNLTAPVGRDFTNPTVAPVRECQLAGGAGVTRTTRKHTTYDMDFLSLEEFPGSGSDYTTLDGIPYLQCSAVTIGPLAGIIRQPVYVVDDGVGFPTLIAQRSIIDHTYSVTVAHGDMTAQRSFRDFLGDVRGRDGLFWIADWEGGLGVTASNTDTSLDFTAKVSDETSHVGRYLNFGTEFRAVLTSTDLGGGVHRVTFDALTADAESVRFMRKARMNTDRINITHVRGLSARTNFSVIEVPA